MHDILPDLGDKLTLLHHIGLEVILASTFAIRLYLVIRALLYLLRVVEEILRHGITDSFHFMLKPFIISLVY